MSNMGYCRFQNTLSDLRDCYHHMNDNDKMSAEEHRARKWLIDLCCRIADEYGELEEVNVQLWPSKEGTS